MKIKSSIIIFLLITNLLIGCLPKTSPTPDIPDGWEYVEMANGEIVLYEPVKEKNGQILYSRYNPADPEANHRELKRKEVRWQPLLTKKEIESKRWVQNKYKTLKY